VCVCVCCQLVASDLHHLLLANNSRRYPGCISHFWASQGPFNPRTADLTHKARQAATHCLAPHKVQLSNMRVKPSFWGSKKMSNRLTSAPPPPPPLYSLLQEQGAVLFKKTSQAFGSGSVFTIVNDYTAFCSRQYPHWSSVNMNSAEQLRLGLVGPKILLRHRRLCFISTGCLVGKGVWHILPTRETRGGHGHTPNHMMGGVRIFARASCDVVRSVKIGNSELLSWITVL